MQDLESSFWSPPVADKDMMPDDTRRLKTVHSATSQMSHGIPLHRAQSLTDGGNIAHIDLDGQTYTLRITRAGKLILTK